MSLPRLPRRPPAPPTAASESDAAPVVARARVTRTPRGAADDRAPARPQPVRPRIAREAPATEGSDPPRPVAWVRTPAAEPGAAVPTARPATPAPQRSPLRRAFDGLRRRPAAERDTPTRVAARRRAAGAGVPAALRRRRRSDPESRAAGPHGRAGSGSFAIPAHASRAAHARPTHAGAANPAASTGTPPPRPRSRSRSPGLPHPPRRPPSPARLSSPPAPAC